MDYIKLGTVQETYDRLHAIKREQQSIMIDDMINFIANIVDSSVDANNATVNISVVENRAYVEVMYGREHFDTWINEYNAYIFELLLPPEKSVSIKAMAWSDAKPPTEGVCYYDHVTATTPFGKVTITWKSWKESPSYDIQDIPWGDLDLSLSAELYGHYSLDEAKSAFERLFSKKINECIDNG